ESRGFFDTDAERAHVLSDAGKINLAEGPQFARLLGLLAAIDAIEAALRLIAAGIVVDHRHGVDVPACRRLDFCDVIPEASIARESHDRPFGTSAFGAETGRKSPTQMPGTANIALPRRSEIEHPAHPHPGMAGIDDDDRIIGNMPGELAAKSLRPHRHCIRGERGLIFVAPLSADRLRFADPVFAFRGAGAVG